jgi:hypothetical protein
LKKKKSFGTTSQLEYLSIWYFVHPFEINLDTHLSHLIRFRQQQRRFINDPMAKPGLCSRCKGVARPVACTMLEGGPCSACKEREAIREKIEQLEEEITQLKAKHHALGSRINEIHDPFIHKLPLEIGSHIFRLCFPVLDFEDIQLWREAATFTGALRLGAVCRKWRELAWATPDLWDTLYLRISPSVKCSLAELLPVLLCEWLNRSGMRPLTIFFRYYVCSEETALVSAADLVIEVINLYSGRWRSLHLDVDADIPERLCGSIHPNQLLYLELEIDGERSPTQKFVMKSKPFPTQLLLTNFPPTMIDIGWENITRAMLYKLSANECLEVLQRTPALEHCLAEPWDDSMVNPGTTILHRRLRSLNSSYSGTGFLEAINLPSLKEWVHTTEGDPLSVTAMVSLLKRSGCCLKILNLQHILAPPDDLPILFQTLPSLERLQLSFWSVESADGVMDDIFARIFNSPPGNSTIPPEDASHESFLPRLHFLECTTFYGTAPFSWNHIPQLYRQGHRRPLMLKSTARESHISDEIALELLKLTDEGVNLQILDQTTEVGGDFLENFRKKIFGLSSTDSLQRK